MPDVRNKSYLLNLFDTPGRRRLWMVDISYLYMYAHHDISDSLVTSGVCKCVVSFFTFDRLYVRKQLVKTTLAVTKYNHMETIGTPVDTPVGAPGLTSFYCREFTADSMSGNLH